MGRGETRGETRGAGAVTMRHNRAMPLISPEALLAGIGDPDLRIVDARWYLGQPGRGRAAYEIGHLPGAVHLDLDADLSGPQGPGRHPLPDPANFARRMGEVGIGSGHLVVGYDDVGGWVAARLWWMLERLGHRRVRVLDGGLRAWLAAGGSLTTARPAWPAAQFGITGGWTGTIDRDALRARLGQVVLLDARAAERYRGEVEPIDPVAGHIPTAISAPLEGNLAPDGRFLSPAALAMRLAGLPDPTLYVGSWSDWSRASYPVATGPEPGTPQ